jgi:hypothetical protein
MKKTTWLLIATAAFASFGKWAVAALSATLALFSSIQERRAVHDDSGECYRRKAMQSGTGRKWSVHVRKRAARIGRTR